MRRALTLCSLLLLPLAGCDPELALGLAEHVETTPTPEPPITGTDPCGPYCEAYRDVCGSEYFAYESYDECEALCAYGADPETGENPQAECRTKALLDETALELGQVEQVCADAGPDSAVCGTAYVVTCERYCDTFTNTCASHSSTFDSDAKCLAWCDGQTLEGAGDTIECRIDSLSPVFSSPSCADASPDSEACR